MTYRNVFFRKNIIASGKGSVDVYYYGKMFGHADVMKNFNQLYDSATDLVVQCSECAKKKYRNFIKIDKSKK